MYNTFKSKENNKNISSLPSIFSGLAALLIFLILLISSDTAIEYMKKGLRLCVATVIPSLFPFMVISELIVSSGIGLRLSRIFAKPMRALFNVSEGAASAYILGAVCGFPIGAKAAVSMYDRGMMPKDELERVLTFCNNPGSAFVISAVGVSFFGNKALGILLYICVILSSLIIGFSAKLFFPKAKPTSAEINVSGSCDVKMITDAVQSSALSMLTVCAYVVFFSAFVGCTGAILSHFSVPCEIIALIFGFFEISSGVGAAADVDIGMSAVLLCALFSGWSGLSVHFQIMSVCSGRNINFKPYFIAKAAQGIICAALMGMAMKFIFPLLSSEGSFVFSPQYENYSDPSLLCIAFFTASLMPFLLSFICDIKLAKSFRKSRKKLKKGIDKHNFV